jgi:hypothetical protein
MHFTGMAALAAPGVVSYDPGLVVVSLVFGTVSAIAAMALLARRSLALASVFLILAVVSMHFIAMGSITLDLSTGIEIPLLGIPKPVLAIATWPRPHRSSTVTSPTDLRGRPVASARWRTRHSRAWCSSVRAASPTSTERCANWRPVARPR